MNTTPEQIDIWRASPTETQNLEFKEAKTQFDHRRLLKYCVAIANEGGGHLLLGIADTLPRPVVGTLAISNTIEKEAEIFRALGFRVDIQEVLHPDGRVVVLHVPSRPLGTAYQYEGAYLMRAGESLVPMTEDRLRAIFSEGQPDWVAQPAQGDLSSQDVIELLDTQTFFELLKQPFPTTQEAIVDRLVQERLVIQSGDTFSITCLGALLLARSLKNFPAVSRKAPRVVVYTTNSKTSPKLDQIGAKGYAVGFEGLIEFIMAQLPQNELIEKALRVEAKLVPEIVIRELVANALIHQDLSVTGASVMIEIFEDRVEISNPGEPIVPLERFIDGYQSRNEWMADIMRRLYICEERSSGIDRVVEQAEICQLPAPDFETTYRRTVVTVWGPRPFGQMDRSERIRACFQHCSLRRVMGNPMTNQSLRERFSLPANKVATVSQVISMTMDEGLIKQDESAGKSTKYRRYLPFWA